MDLNELLGWQSPADFVRNHFLKFPFVAAHGCQALVEIRRDLKHDIRWRQRLPQHLLQPLVGSGAGLAAPEDSLPPTSQHDNPDASEQVTQWRDLTLGLASDLVRRITCGNLPPALAADLAARFTTPDTPSPAPAHDERDHAD